MLCKEFRDKTLIILIMQNMGKNTKKRTMNVVIVINLNPI